MFQHCSQCSGNNLIEGRFEESGKLVFSLSEARKPLSDHPVAYTCADCGHIHLTSYPEKMTICFCKDLPA